MAHFFLFRALTLRPEPNRARCLLYALTVEYAATYSHNPYFQLHGQLRSTCRCRQGDYGSHPLEDASISMCNYSWPPSVWFAQSSTRTDLGFRDPG